MSCICDCSCEQGGFINGLMCVQKDCGKILPMAFCSAHHHVLCKYHHYLGYCPKCLDTNIVLITDPKDVVFVRKMCIYMRANGIIDNRGYLKENHPQENQTHSTELND
uniref:Uncharacterized protein n=1 Tax=Cacopsylla melanoneura TaxID=428564 RepID=A0A8D8X2I2_9HEMI